METDDDTPSVSLRAVPGDAVFTCDVFKLMTILNLIKKQSFKQRPWYIQVYQRILVCISVMQFD